MKKFLRSFYFALEGLWALLKTERNFRVEMAVALLVLFLMFYLDLTFLERLILFFVTMAVLIMEIVNTVLEKLLDLQGKRKNRRVKFLKDAMAGAVLLTAILALVSGLFIFGHYFFKSRL